MTSPHSSPLSCIYVAISSLAVFVVLAGGWLSHDGTAHADDIVAASPAGDGQLRPYEKVRGFYELAESHDAICADYLAAVNGEKVYDPNDERDLLLGTDLNYSWQFLFASGGWEVPPSGSWEGHRISTDEWIHNSGSLEQLAVDLDDDGNLEYLYRWTAQIRSRNFHEVILLDHQATTYDIRYLLGYSEPPGTWNRRSTEKDVLTHEMTRRLFAEVDSDFFLMEVVAIEGRHLLVAASAFHSKGLPARTYVMTVRPDRSINVACYLKSKFGVGQGAGDIQP